jgi:hypothetical protein
MNSMNSIDSMAGAWWIRRQGLVGSTCSMSLVSLMDSGLSGFRARFNLRAY